MPLTAFAPADFAVDRDIRTAQTLPPAAFVDPGFLELELATIFARHFQLVPERPAAERAGDARPLPELTAQRGSRLPFTLAGKSLFLQRGWDDDALRAFPNTCTHAWYPLVLGPGRGNTVVCAQHGRKFDCAGRFLAQRGFGADVPGFPRDCDHLPPLPVERLGELLFTVPGPGAPARPWERLMAPVRASLEKLPLDRLKLTSAPGLVEAREVAGNWKQHAWNYMDWFHISFIHRAPGGLADAIDLGSYTTELHDGAALQWVYARRPEHGFDPAHLPERFADASGAGRRVFALWWFVFPNLTLNFYPWGLSVNVYQPIPGRPDATWFLWYHWVLDEAKYARREHDWLASQVDAEDVDAMAQVRRGLRSGHAVRGRFSPAEEHGPHWFHREVFEAVFSGG